MTHETSRCLLLAALLCASTTVAAEDAPITFVEVADGVLAGLQPHATRFDDANVIVIEGRDAVLIVDAPTSRAAVDAVVAEIRKRTKTPVRYVVNTHWHDDHTQGNQGYRQAFGDDVVFIGHETLLEDIPDRAAKSLAERVEQYETMIPEAEAQLAKGLGLRGQELDEEQQQRQAAAIEQARAWLATNRDVRFVVPQLTYSTRLELDLGELAVQLLHQRAHTSGDTVIWIPDRAVLVTGDMLDDLPYVGHGHPKSWVASLESLRTLPFKSIIPGHGPVFTGKEKLDVVHGFVSALVAHSERGVAAGETDEALLASFDTATWRDRLAGDDVGGRRFFDAVLAEAVARAREEAAGEKSAD